MTLLLLVGYSTEVRLRCGSRREEGAWVEDGVGGDCGS